MLNRFNVPAAGAALAFTIGLSACEHGVTPTPQVPSSEQASSASSGQGSKLFIESAVENADGTATFPLQRGTSRGQTVWYIVLDASSGSEADARRVNRAQKLANARGTSAVQRVSIINGVIDFPATVDFRPFRQITPGPQGFPPAVAQPGAVGEAGYSPLIELPDGTILNAPHLANTTGKADKVMALNTVARTVRYLETNGFQGGKALRYVSTESSNPVAATLENATYAPALNALPFVGGDGTNSARASLAAFANGQTGATNPQRQGLNSALLDGLDPLNVLAWNPSQGRYSPMWDVFLTQWKAAAVAIRQNKQQRDFGTIENLGKDGVVTSPDGTSFAPAGFIVNCPIVSLVE